ncbi:MAG TPA: amino acid racemase [Gemmatimonadaceae bacterium]|nr:amino acid racemase [Gemmatimonadaceae bacterium]
MKRAGIVGGLGPESTIDYYRRILDEWNKREPANAPSLIIDSLDPDRALYLVANDRAALIDYFADSVSRLVRGGADFIAITANTPHIIFDEISARSTVPLISIVETCAEEARRRGLTRLALLGTRFTMEASFYPDVFRRFGLSVLPPDESDRVWVHDRYVNQLLKGDFRDDTREQFIDLITRMRDVNEIDAVILGGTELPLLLSSSQVAGLPLLDTTALHVDAIVNRLRN